MVKTKPYPGVIGLNLYFDFPADKDISTATTAQIKAKHGSTEKTWTATIINSTRLLYTTISSDIDASGIWYLQPYIVFPSGFNPYCYTCVLKVYDFYE